MTAEVIRLVGKICEEVDLALYQASKLTRGASVLK